MLLQSRASAKQIPTTCQEKRLPGYHMTAASHTSFHHRSARCNSLHTRPSLRLFWSYTGLIIALPIRRNSWLHPHESFPASLLASPRASRPRHSLNDVQPLLHLHAYNLHFTSAAAKATTVDRTAPMMMMVMMTSHTPAHLQMWGNGGWVGWVGVGYSDV